MRLKKQQQQSEFNTREWLLVRLRKSEKGAKKKKPQLAPRSQWSILLLYDIIISPPHLKIQQTNTEDNQFQNLIIILNRARHYVFFKKNNLNLLDLTVMTDSRTLNLTAMSDPRALDLTVIPDPTYLNITNIPNLINEK